MTTLMMQGHDADAVIAERRRRGIDRYDEVRLGVYHVVPEGTRGHGRYQARLLALLERARPDLIVTGPVNLGEEDDYRIPDAAILPPGSDDEVFVPHALLVGEVRSRDDDTYEKFGHYAQHGVLEVLVVLPSERRVEVWRRSSSAEPSHPYQAGSSEILGLTGEDVWRGLDEDAPPRE